MEDTELGATQLGDRGATGRARAPMAALKKGDALGRYVVLDVLGAGGMGVVYSAYDPELDRRVAIKLLRSGFDNEAGDSLGRSRLIREAQALARLQHPNVVTVHDVGEHAGQVFVAMEFVDGITLRAWSESSARAWRAVLDVLMCAGRGLQAAHAEGLVHRDFKPDNVMLERGDDTEAPTRVLVMDFGLASPSGRGPHAPADVPSQSAGSLSAAELLTNLTQTGAIMGTPAYMAPEQHRGAPVDARTDQFCFCVALYEALYGQRPFAGTTLPVLVANCTEGNILPPPPGSGVPRWLRVVIVRGLAVRPDARWPSMGALLTALAKDPTRARRRWIGAGTAVAAIGLAYGANVLWERGRLAECRAGAQSIDEVYDDHARVRIRDRILGTGLPYARDTWQRLQPRLDARAEAWSDQRYRACAAAPALDEALKVVQSECLEGQRIAFGDQIELLAHADRSVVQSALTANDGAETEDCLDLPTLRRRSPLPDDPELRTRVTALRRDLLRAPLLRDAGRYAEALASAEATIAIAESLADARVLARARAERGKTLRAMRRFEEAETELEAAFFAARRASDDPLAASVSRVLVLLVGFDLARARDGRRWGAHAETLALAGTPSVLEGARLAHNIGLLEVAAGNYDAALVELQAAQALAERDYGAHSTLAIENVESLAIVYDRLAQGPRAIELLRQVLRWREETYGVEHPAVATAHNDLAAALLSVRRFEEARSHLLTAIEICEAADLAAATGPPLDNLALVERELGNLESALAASERALTTRRNTLPRYHPAIGDGLINHGQILEKMGNAPGAIADFRAGLEIYEQGEDPNHPSIAGAAYTLSIAYYRLGEAGPAAEFARRAIQVYRASLPANHPTIGWAVLALAVAAAKQNDHQLVLETLATYVGEVDEVQLPVDLRVALAFATGDALLAMGRAPEALARATQALALAEDPSTSPGNRELVRDLLARALWEADGDRTRAVALATQALTALRDLDDVDPPDIDKIEAWLREHPAPDSPSP